MGLCLAAAVAVGPAAGPAGSCSVAPPGVLLGTGSLAMVHVNSTAACCQACAGRAGCEAFSYEESDRKCFLKDNVAKGRCTHAGCISGTAASPLPPAPPGPGPPAPAPPARPAAGASGTLTINVSAPIAHFSPHFLGVNADWWLDGCGGEGVNWSDDASIALVNLSNSRLKVLAKGLCGGTLRVGGTHGDSVTYGVGSGGVCPAPATRCYPICLTPERWKAIVGFAADAGLKLAFGLNMQAKNISNIEALLRFTQAEGLDVDTWELGNELGVAHIEQLGPDIAALVKSLWPEGAPLLVGPDDAGDGDDASRVEFTKLAGEQTYLHAITHESHAP
jgi:hypothetical protein